MNSDNQLKRKAKSKALEQNENPFQLLFNRASFGRHETFGLRYGWLTKGFQASAQDEAVFESDDATVTLGVGVNMVSSIKYWLKACRVMEAQTNQATQFGRLIFDKKAGYDPYLEDEATIWLLHWQLASNPQQATAWYWFFNKFHKAEFTGQEVMSSLADWVKANLKVKASTSTLKSDANLVLRMYTMSKGNTRTPLEDALDSPMSLLRLVSQTAGGRSFQSKPQARPNLPLNIFAYAMNELLTVRGLNGAKTVPIEDLMYSKDDLPSLGAVFRLTENDLITKIEKIAEQNPQYIALRESAGIRQVHVLESKDSNVFLSAHYKALIKGVAA